MMKWIILTGFLICLARSGAGGALKCTPGVEDALCRIDKEDSNKTSLVEGNECAPGTHWKSKCNDCACSPEGHPSCTEKACPGYELELEKECAPESRWKKECNSCWCTPDGLALCTKIGCDGIPANQHFNDESSQGKPDVAVRSSINKTKAVVCVANRMFIKDCNTCWCNEDGTSYFCTRRVCVPELPEETDTDEQKPEQKLRIIKRECRPDEVFEMDCNMCRCNPDGKSFSCTRRACLEQIDEDRKKASLSRKTRGLPQANTQSTPKACEPGKVFRMDCNQCLCDNEGQDFSCTRIDCTALNNINNGGTRTKRDNQFDAIDSSFRCNPGEQYKRGCEDCTCSADGKSIFCSVRLCDKDLAHIID